MLLCEEEEIGGKNKKRRMMKEKMKYKEKAPTFKTFQESGMDQLGTLLCEETWIDVMPISLPSDFINLLVFLDVS